MENISEYTSIVALLISMVAVIRTRKHDEASKTVNTFQAKRRYLQSLTKLITLDHQTKSTMFESLKADKLLYEELIKDLDSTSQTVSLASIIESKERMWEQASNFFSENQQLVAECKAIISSESLDHKKVEELLFLIEKLHLSSEQLRILGTGCEVGPNYRTVRSCQET